MIPYRSQTPYLTLQNPRHLPASAVRDPIHGYIHLEPDQWHIIDTPLLQRLRRIRQLAFTSLVYPGATHTRFEHTLGVAHVASQIAATASLNAEDRRLLGFAALLHDIGHGPFSHLSEQALFEIAESCSGNKPPPDAHEQISKHLLQNDSDICHYIAPYMINDISSILDGTSSNQALCQAISVPIDADKQDYLLRDAHYCGVTYGLYDIDRLHETIRRYPAYDQAPESHLGIRSGGLEATEQFVQARYYMHAQVYSHPVRLCTDYMFIRALLLAVSDDDLQPIAEAFTYDDTSSFACRFATWDDQRLLQYAESEAPPTSKFSVLMKRLRERRLFKRLYHRPVESMPENVRAALASDIPISTKRQIESEIGTSLSIPADDIIFATHSIGWGFKRSSTTDEGTLIIVHDAEPPKECGTESLIFQSIRGSLRRTFVSIYAPIESVQHRLPQHKIHSIAQDQIAAILESVLGGSLHKQEAD